MQHKLPSRAGTADSVWLNQAADLLQKRRTILDALRDSLAVWEREVDWQDLPADKRAALLALAEESRATLKSMIARLEGELNPICDQGNEQP